MNIEKNFRRLYNFCWPLVHLFYPVKAYGVENIPEGPAVICPLHSNLPDPFIVAIAMGKKNRVRPLAKEEVAENNFFRWILEKIGSVFVRRGESDIEAYKSCIRILKGGEKLLAFPEGTRVHSNTVLPAKTGVIRMAVRTGVPIVPVYLPRDKCLFRHVDIVFGKPYTIEKATHADYDRLAQELMDKIWALKEAI